MDHLQHPDAGVLNEKVYSWSIRALGQWYMSLSQGLNCHFEVRYIYHVLKSLY